MNTGKTLFAQLMDFLPWTTFTRIVDRYGGDHRVRTLSCAEQYRSMAFAQLTYRESLRDIETCLSVHASKLYHMGFRQPVRRSTLADANERRDWRIHAALAQRLITQARTLYVDEELGLDLTNTVYALARDHRSVPVGLSVGALPHHQGGGEDAHAARPAGQHSVLSTSRMASCTTFMPSICSCRKPEPSTSIVATSTLPALQLGMCCTKPGLLRHACQVEHRCSSRLRRRRIVDRHHLRPDHLPGRLLHPSGLPRTLRRIRFKDPESGKTLVFITNNFSLPAATICALYAAGGATLLQVDQAASSDQAVLRHVRTRRRRSGLPSRSTSSVKAPRPGRLALHVTDPLGDPLRENAHTSSTCGRRKQMQRFANNQPIEFIRFLTGH